MKIVAMKYSAFWIPHYKDPHKQPLLDQETNTDYADLVLFAIFLIVKKSRATLLRCKILRPVWMIGTNKILNFVHGIEIVYQH